jgi:hypothetical protein
MIIVYSVKSPDFQSSQITLQEIDEEHTDETSKFSYDPIDDHEFCDAVLTEPEAEADSFSARTTPAQKKQKKSIKDVSEVRRSQRIAKICDGYKDKEAADQAKDKGNLLLLKISQRRLEGRKNSKLHLPSLVLSLLRLSMKMPHLHLSFPLALSKPLALTVARFLLVRFLWRNSLPHVTNVLGQSSIYFVLSL